MTSHLVTKKNRKGKSLTLENNSNRLKVKEASLRLLAPKSFFFLSEDLSPRLEYVEVNHREKLLEGKFHAVILL